MYHTCNAICGITSHAKTPFMKLQSNTGKINLVISCKPWDKLAACPGCNPSFNVRQLGQAPAPPSPLTVTLSVGELGIENEWMNVRMISCNWKCSSTCVNQFNASRQWMLFIFAVFLHCLYSLMEEVISSTTHLFLKVVHYFEGVNCHSNCKTLKFLTSSCSLSLHRDFFFQTLRMMNNNNTLHTCVTLKAYHVVCKSDMKKGFL